MGRFRDVLSQPLLISWLFLAPRLARLPSQPRPSAIVAALLLASFRFVGVNSTALPYLSWREPYDNKAAQAMLPWVVMAIGQS